MTRALFALITILLAANAGTACPDPVEVNVSPRIVEQLMSWIASNTNYDMSEIAEPAIQFCATDVTYAADDAKMITDPALRAAYDPLTSTIYMTAPWSPIDAEMTSILLHEMVHHVQIQAREWPCLVATGFEAYWLQDQWLGEQGYGTGFDWTQILVDSRCPVTSKP